MDKNLILKLVIEDFNNNNNVNYSEEDIELFNSIYEAITEIEVANSMFNSVSEPQLVDLAIHTQDAANSRLNYLISQAKKRELKNIKII